MRDVMHRIAIDPKTTPQEAENLNIHEVRSLVSWCDWQNESLWDSGRAPALTLQQILSIYHATAAADYFDFQSYLEACPKAANAAWNRIVHGKE